MAGRNSRRGDPGDTLAASIAALVGALDIERGMTLADANAAGYATVAQIAASAGVSKSSIERRLAARGAAVESVRIAGCHGVLHAYRVR